MATKTVTLTRTRSCHKHTVPAIHAGKDVTRDFYNDECEADDCTKFAYFTVTN
jgi:hypothetical protein